MATLKTYNICAADSWVTADAVAVGDRRLTSTLQLIEITVAGVTASEPDFTGVEGSLIIDGTAEWKFLCVQDYAVLTDFVADIGVGISDTLVTADETWKVFIYHDRRGAYVHTASGDLSFAEACDATHKVVIRPAPGDSWQEGMNRGVDPLRYNENYGVAIEVNGNLHAVKLSTNTDFCEVHDLLVRLMNGNAYGFSLQIVGQLVSGCLVHATVSTNASRKNYQGTRGTYHNCIGISESPTAHQIFSIGYVGVMSNCLAVYVGTPAVGQEGIKVGSATLRVINCLSIGNDTDFTNLVSTRAESTGNVSSDGSAAVQFPTQADQIINATDLVTDFSSIAMLNLEPLAASSAMVVNPSETDFTYSPANDVFGDPRTIGTANFRGPIVTLPTAADFSLAIQSLVLAVKADQVSTTTAAPLPVDGLAVAPEMEQVAVVGSSPLSLAAIATTPLIETVTTVAGGALSAVDLQISPAIDAVTAVGVGLLTLNDVAVNTEIEAAALVAAAPLSLADMSTTPEVAAVSLATFGSLTLMGLGLALQIDGVDLLGSAGLALDDIRAAVSIENVPVAAIGPLVLNELSVATQMDAITATNEAGLILQALAINATVDQLSVVGEAALSLQSLGVTPEMQTTILVAGLLKLPINPSAEWVNDTRLVQFVDDLKSVQFGE